MSRISQTACFIAAYEFCISHLYIAKKFKIFQNFLIICLCTLTLLICTCCLSYFFNTKRPFRNFHSKWPYLLQRQEAFGFLMFYSGQIRNQRFLSVSTDTNTNFTSLLTQDIVVVNYVFPYMASHTIFNEISCISFSISCKLDVHTPSDTRICLILLYISSFNIFVAFTAA